MPKNRYIYFGIVLLVATTLLWVGTLLAKLISWILPYTGLAAIVLIIIGVYLEYDRAKSKNRGDKP